MIKTQIICDQCGLPVANEVPGYFYVRLAEAPHRLIVDFGTIETLGYSISETTKLVCSEHCLFAMISKVMDRVYSRKPLVGEQVVT